MIVACVMIVGYVEDPCTTEGLMQGVWNNEFDLHGTPLSLKKTCHANHFP